ncbi:UDP-glucose dehydrogenase family protein [Gandjariella thermophila]|uniref:UDP-glucose 6-dehydrogenase n=1 Tax=Gandjariella thermophila TaxID=1931992 RepID=A0A4D4JG33_9PSEU|nr:UDP-glucose/GDP-mannose dehydrogenase family protein [Gandjariella thermophila]GDY33366.1 UDP-glucose 6-dehydrogenase [Gandjariella thermophila]
MRDPVIGVVGAGYVGLTTTACLAHLGNRVICVDVDGSKVDGLRHGEVPIAEPGLAELVAEGLAARRLEFTTDASTLGDAEVVLLCLPTPMGEAGVADLSVLESALGELAGVLAPGCVVVMKSTVPVGTTARAGELLGRSDVPVVSNPEFLREGHAVHDFLHPDRIVVGTEDTGAAARVVGLYAALDAPVLRTDPASAELAKYASNAFLALKLSYVNALAELCERVGADVRAVGRVLGLDNRIGPAFLAPGPGWGGSCLPKDTSALLRTAEAAGVDFGLLRETVAVNVAQRERVVRKVRRAVTGSPRGSLAGVRLGLLGLTFKAGTDDLRHSPALAVAAELSRAGAVLTAYDPRAGGAGHPDLDGIALVDDPYLVAKDAAGIVLLTEWPEFRDLDWATLAALADHAAVVDTRNLLDPDTLCGTGWVHTGIGTPGDQDEPDGTGGADGPRADRR